MAEEHGDPAPDVGFHAAFAERHHHDVDKLAAKWEKRPSAKNGLHAGSRCKSVKFLGLFGKEKHVQLANFDSSEG